MMLKKHSKHLHILFTKLLIVQDKCTKLVEDQISLPTLINTTIT